MKKAKIKPDGYVIEMIESPQTRLASRRILSVCNSAGIRWGSLIQSQSNL